MPVISHQLLCKKKSCSQNSKATLGFSITPNFHRQEGIVEMFREGNKVLNIMVSISECNSDGYKSIAVILLEWSTDVKEKMKREIYRRIQNYKKT
jgi:hypothetical protein